ncbi:MAG: hypothetical protein OHK0053_29490 [Microscillaceae bacterium]
MKSLAIYLYWYYYALPFLGYMAVYFLGPKSFGMAIFMGWLVMILYHTLYIGQLKHKLEQNPQATALPLLIPILLIGLNQLWVGGNLLHFFLEHTIVEAISVALGFGILLFFGRNELGKTAWEDMGCTPLILVGFILAGISSFVLTWVEVWQMRNFLPWGYRLQAFAALIFAIFANTRLLFGVAGGRVDIVEVQSETAILWQLGAWFIALPLCFYLLQLVFG